MRQVTFLTSIYFKFLYDVVTFYSEDDTVLINVKDDIGSWVSEFARGSVACGSGNCDCVNRGGNSYGGQFSRIYQPLNVPLSQADATHTIQWVDSDGKPIDKQWLRQFFGPQVHFKSNSFIAGFNDIENQGNNPALTCEYPCAHINTHSRTHARAHNNKKTRVHEHTSVHT